MAGTETAGSGTGTRRDAVAGDWIFRTNGASVWLLPLPMALLTVLLQALVPPPLGLITSSSLVSTEKIEAPDRSFPYQIF
jgi:hypothetical protein